MTRTRPPVMPPDHQPDNFMQWAFAFRVGSRATKGVDWGYVKDAHRRGEKNIHTLRHSMKYILPLSLLLLLSCKKEEQQPVPPYSQPGWSRGTPTLLAPADGSVVTSNSTIPFAWSSVHDATQYFVDIRRIAGPDTFTVLAWTLPDTTRIFGTVNMPIGQPIIWRVEAQRPGAAPPTSGPPSPWFTFTRQ